jgi:uncharacterized protein (DUF2062 family)
MFRIYKRSIHIGNTENPQQLEYRVEENAVSGMSKVLAIPAMVFGAVIATLVFSVFFAVLLIPLGIIGFKAWRMMNRLQRQSLRETEAESLSAEYTVVSDQDKN